MCIMNVVIKLDYFMYIYDAMFDLNPAEASMRMGHERRIVSRK